MRFKWLRKLIGCRCLEPISTEKQAVERSQMPGVIIFLDDEAIAKVEEQERLERLFKES